MKAKKSESVLRNGPAVLVAMLMVLPLAGEAELYSPQASDPSKASETTKNSDRARTAEPAQQQGPSSELGNAHGSGKENLSGGWLHAVGSSLVDPEFPGRVIEKVIAEGVGFFC